MGASLAFSLLPQLGVGRVFLQYPGSWCFPDFHLCPWTPLRHRLYTLAMGALGIACMTVMVLSNLMVIGEGMRSGKWWPKWEKRCD